MLPPLTSRISPGLNLLDSCQGEILVVCYRLTKQSLDDRTFEGIFMQRNLLRIFTMLLSLVMIFGGAQSDIAAQSKLIDHAGVESRLLGSVDVDPAAVHGRALLLESLTLPPSGVFEGVTGTSPEIISVTEGTAYVTDGFGFGSDLAVGETVTLASGSEYRLSNTGSSDVIVLRTYFAHIDGEIATPVAALAASAVASPGVEIKRDSLAEIDTSSIAGNSATLYLGFVSLDAASTTGEQAHSGPLGVYVNSGTISMVSPSGLEGVVATNASAALPAQTSLTVRSGDSPAAFYVAGVSEVLFPLFTEIVPPPTQTPEPTLTPVPSLTPTPTIEPSPTIEPTADPAMEQALRDWVTHYAELRSNCDTFGIADLYAEANTDTWAAVEQSLPCKTDSPSAFRIEGEPQIRISGNQATVGFAWREELNVSGSCWVYRDSAVLQFEFVAGEWHPLAQETFGTDRQKTKTYDACEMLDM